MAVSNPAKLTSVKAVFGGPGSLSVYIAGGSYVPAGTSGDNGAVPSSLPLPLSKLAGTVNFTPFTNTYTSGSGTETVPSGAVQLVLSVIGGSGGGGFGNTTDDINTGGGGGGGSGYAQSIINVTGISGSIAWSVGAGGDAGAPNYGTSSTTTSSISGATMTGGYGSGGSAAGPFSPGAGGAGGTASGGNNINNSGGAGDYGGTNYGGAGGSSATGSTSTGGSGGGEGGNGGNPGGGGYIIFAWT